MIRLKRVYQEPGPRDGMRILHRLAGLVKRKRITLIYGAADEQHNHAVVLKELLDELT